MPSHASFVPGQNITCSSRGHPLAVDVMEDELYWVTTMDYSSGRLHDSAAVAALLTMNKFSRNVHSAGHDVLVVLDDLRTELVTAHPALQMPGPDDTLRYYTRMTAQNIYSHLIW